MGVEELIRQFIVQGGWIKSKPERMLENSGYRLFRRCHSDEADQAIEDAKRFLRSRGKEVHNNSSVIPHAAAFDCLGNPIPGVSIYIRIPGRVLKETLVVYRDWECVFDVPYEGDTSVITHAADAFPSADVMELSEPMYFAEIPTPVDVPVEDDQKYCQDAFVEEALRQACIEKIRPELSKLVQTKAGRMRLRFARSNFNRILYDNEIQGDDVYLEILASKKEP